MDIASTYDSIVYGGASTPIVGTTSIPASGGILSNLGSIVTGLSNVGLQWFQAVSNGVSGKVVVPQPTQATPAQTLASALPAGMSMATVIVLGFLAVLAIFAFRRKG